MRIFLVLAAAATLALAGCKTTPDDGTAGTPASSSTSTPASQGVPTPQPSDNLHDRVHDALMEQVGPAVNDLGVRVEGSKVFLTGHVHSEADRQRAHDIAHRVQGAGTVDISGLTVQH
jgi:hypothetical protein